MREPACESGGADLAATIAGRARADRFERSAEATLVDGKKPDALSRLPRNGISPLNADDTVMAPAGIYSITLAIDVDQSRDWSLARRRSSSRYSHTIVTTSPIAATHS